MRRRLRLGNRLALNDARTARHVYFPGSESPENIFRRLRTERLPPMRLAEVRIQSTGEEKDMTFVTTETNL